MVFFLAYPRHVNIIWLFGYFLLCTFLFTHLLLASCSLPTPRFPLHYLPHIATLFTELPEPEIPDQWIHQDSRFIPAMNGIFHVRCFSYILIIPIDILCSFGDKRKSIYLAYLL